MNKIIILVFLMLISQFSFAQTGKGKELDNKEKNENNNNNNNNNNLSVEQLAAKQTAHIQSVTGCSSDQTSKIKTAAIKKFKEIETIKKENVDSRFAKMQDSKISMARKVFRMDLKMILTFEQQKKLRESKKAVTNEEKEEYN